MYQHMRKFNRPTGRCWNQDGKYDNNQLHVDQRGIKYGNMVYEK